MADDKPGTNAAEKYAPFGTQPRRSKQIVIVLGLLYLAWFVILFWMAAFKPGQ